MLKLPNNRLRLLSLVSCFLLLSCETPQGVENVQRPLIIPNTDVVERPIPTIPVATQTQTQPHIIKQEVVQNRVDILSEEILALRMRLIEAYAIYWPLISSEYQHEQLPNVLGDSIPALRVFGIERVAVLLRDGEATIEELQLVVDRLRDPEPTVRMAAAKLLPEINVPGLSEYVSNSLAAEIDIQVATQELLFFQTRPHPSAVNPVIARLELGPIETAADTLIVLLQSADIEQERKQRIVTIVQQTRQTNNLPSLITLEAMLGSDKVKRSLIHLLDNPVEAIRLAVAQGFSSAGFAEPLISRANNAVMYSHALTALQNQGGIGAFIDLMNLHTADDPSWDAAVFAITVSLDTSSLLRADDILKGMQANALRLSILTSIWGDTPERTTAAKKAIARRTVPLMISSGDAVGALQLLDVFGESIVDEDLLALRFAAAIAASAWDTAADVHPEPIHWITAWQALKKNDPATATVIKQQIIQRFDEQLTQSQRESLGIEQTDTTPNNTPS